MQPSLRLLGLKSSSKAVVRPKVRRFVSDFLLLEDRNLMAVTSSVASGLLNVTGDGADDTIRVRLRAGDNNTIEVLSGTQVINSVARSNVTAGIVVDGGAGNDKITIDFATTVPTTLRGGAGNDFIQGGAGNESLEGGTGVDTLVGGPGADLFAITPSLTKLTVSGAESLSARLGDVQTSLNEKVFGKAVPLVGSALGKTGSIGQIIAGPTSAQGLQRALSVAVRSGVGGGGDAADALYDDLGPDNQRLLADTDGSGTVDRNDVRVITNTVAGNVVFDLLLRADRTGRASFDLGMPKSAFNLDAPTDKVDLAVGYDFPVQVGVDSVGTPFVATPANKPLVITVTATAARVSNLMGSTGIFRSRISDDTTQASTFTGKYTVNLAASKVDSSALTGAANLHFKLKNNFGDGSAFDLGVLADFELTKSYMNANTAATGAFGSPAVETFKNVKLDMGMFFTKFVAPIFSKIQTVTKPLQPLIDFFNFTIPVLSEIMGSPVTVATLVSRTGRGGDSLVKFLKIAGVINAFDVGNSIPDLGSGNAFLPLGDFIIGGVESETPSVLPESLSVSVGTVALKKEATKEVEKETVQMGEAGQPAKKTTRKAALKAGAEAGAEFGLADGFAFPFLDDSKMIARGLLGEDITLFTCDLPELSAGFSLEASFSPFLPIPLVIGVSGGFSVTADLKFGFDTSGLTEYANQRASFIQSGISPDAADSSVVANGFYVSDTENADGTGEDTPEFTITGEIGLSAALGLDFKIVSFEAGIKGSIKAGLEFDLHDIPDEEGEVDGKMHLDELSERAMQSPLCIFDITAFLRASASVFATATLGGFITIFDVEYELGSVDILAAIGVDPAVFACPDVPPPELFTFADGVVTLRTDMANRTAKDDHLVIRHKDGVAGNETITIASGKNSMEVSGVRSIVGNLGADNDTLAIFPGVLADVNINGGAGDDSITYLGSGRATIVGGAGNDRLRSAGSQSRLFGGNENGSLIDGADDDDLTYSGTGVATLAGGGGDDSLTGVSGVVTLLGEAGNDMLTGGPNNDSLDGGFGNDSLMAGAGDDRLIGGPDTLAVGDADEDVLEGEDGDDFLFGGAGSDALNGGLDIDTCSGGLGSDKFIWKSGDGPDALDGGIGSDTPMSKFMGGDFLMVVGTPGVDKVLILQDPKAANALLVSVNANGALRAVNMETVRVDTFAGSDSVDVDHLGIGNEQNINLHLNNGDESKDGVTDTVTFYGSAEDASRLSIPGDVIPSMRGIPSTPVPNGLIPLVAVGIPYTGPRPPQMVVTTESQGTFEWEITLPVNDSATGLPKVVTKIGKTFDFVPTNIGVHTVRLKFTNLNGDVVSNVNTFNVQIPSFDPATKLPNIQSLAVATGDLNRDGRDDIISVGTGGTGLRSDKVNILMATSAGEPAFHSQDPAPFFDATARVALADMNNDGILDLVRSTNSGTIEMRPGNGNGTFKAVSQGGNSGVVPGTAFLSSVGFVIADVNGDGKLDVVIPSATEPKVHVFLAGSSSQYTLISTTLLDSRVAASIALADMNGDGFLDLVATHREFGRNLETFLGDGTGNFRAGRSFQIFGRGNAALAVGDVNGDAILDVLVDTTGFGPMVLLGNGDGGFQSTPGATGSEPAINTITLPFFETVTSAAFVDLNNDGRLDALVARDGGRIGIFLGNGNGSFGPLLTPDLGGIVPKRVETGDINNDGRLDLIVRNAGGFNTSRLFTYLGNGDGSFKTAVEAPILRNEGASLATDAFPDVAVGDVNGDGRNDIVVTVASRIVDVATSSQIGVRILLNSTFKPAQSFNLQVTNASITGSTAATTDGGRAVVVADFTGDGNADLAIASSRFPIVSVYPGNGDGTFGAARITTLDYMIDSLAVGDFNRDGRPDLAAADYSGGLVLALVNSGSGTFFVSTPSVNPGPRSIDINGDRIPDNFALGATPLSVTVGDFNGDSFPDIAATTMDVVDSRGLTQASPSNSRVVVYLNRGSSSVPFQNAFVTTGSLRRAFYPSTTPLTGFPDFVNTNPSRTDIVRSSSGPLFVDDLPGSFGALFTGQLFAPNAGTVTYTLSTFDGSRLYIDGVLIIDNSLPATGTRQNSGSVFLTRGYHDFRLDYYRNSGSTFGSISLSVPAGQQVGTFAIPGAGSQSSSFPVGGSGGSNPRSVAAGDFNNDGKLDLVVANQDASPAGSGGRRGTVSLLLGNGNGSFQAAKDFLTASQVNTGQEGPRSLVVGDFNKDGALDVMTANFNSQRDSTVSELRGKVANNVVTVTPYVVPAGTAGNQDFSGPQGMDFDVNIPITVTHLGVFDDRSDGLKSQLKVILYNRDSRTLMASATFVVGNTGTLEGGSRFLAFTFPITLPAGFRGTIVAEGFTSLERLGNQGAGSVPGLTTNSGNGAVAFVGGGRFGFTPGAFPTNIDGGPANRYANATFKFTVNQPTSTFSDPIAYDVGKSPATLAVGDFNADGRKDVVAVNLPGSGSGFPTLAILTNNRVFVNPGGPYTVAEGGSLQLDATGTIADSLVGATYSWDVNGDGVFGDATGSRPTLSWDQLKALGIKDGPRTVRNVDVLVNLGGRGTRAFTKAILNVVNTLRTVTISGPAEIEEGGTYTLQFSSTDPGVDTVNRWTILWGDDASTTLPGNATSATHQYTDNGSFNITVFATDEDTTATSRLTAFPSSEKLKPVIRAVDAQVNFAQTIDATFPRLPNVKENTAVRWTGSVNITANGGDGITTFFVQSFGAAQLFIDGQLVVDDSVVHTDFRKKSGTIAGLSLGLHDLRLEYYQPGFGSGVILSFAQAGQAETVIPASVLSHIEPGLLDATSLIFSDSFDGYKPGINLGETQPGTGLKPFYNGSIPGWTGAGGNAVRAVNLGGGNYAPMFLNDETLTLQNPINANVANQLYTVRFDAGPTNDGANPSRNTIFQDSMYVNVLRANGSIVVRKFFSTGFWLTGPDAQALKQFSFNYTGDGTGPVRIQIGSVFTASGRFGGAIDNLSVSLAANRGRLYVPPVGTVRTSDPEQLQQVLFYLPSGRLIVDGIRLTPNVLPVFPVGLMLKPGFHEFQIESDTDQLPQIRYQIFGIDNNVPANEGMLADGDPLVSHRLPGLLAEYYAPTTITVNSVAPTASLSIVPALTELPRDFSALQLAAVTHDATIDIPHPAGKGFDGFDSLLQDFAGRWTGTIYIQKDGFTQFSLTGVGGGHVFIDNGFFPVVSIGNLGAANTIPVTAIGNEVFLTAGPHSLRVEVFEPHSGSNLPGSGFTLGQRVEPGKTPGKLIPVVGPPLGNVLRFDGANDFVEFPRPVQDDFTIEFSINTTQFAFTNGQYWQGAGLVSGELPGIPNDFGISLAQGRILFGTVNAANNNDLTIRSGNIADGKWHHVAATRQKSTGRIALFIDGVMVAEGVGTTNTLNGPSMLRLGSHPTNVNFFAGMLDDVRFWRTVRTQQQIADNRALKLDPKAQPDLISYYLLDETSGTIAQDSTGRIGGAGFLLPVGSGPTPFNPATAARFEVVPATRLAAPAAGFFATVDDILERSAPVTGPLTVLNAFTGQPNQVTATTVRQRGRVLLNSINGGDFVFVNFSLEFRGLSQTASLILDGRTVATTDTSSKFLTGVIETGNLTLSPGFHDIEIVTNTIVGLGDLPLARLGEVIDLFGTGTFVFRNAVPASRIFAPGGVLAEYFFSREMPMGGTATLVLGGAVDPSSTDTQAGFRYSFDFNNDGDFTDPGEVANSPSSSIVVPASLLANPGSVTIHGRITDKDGAFSDTFSSLRVVNKDVTTTLLLLNKINIPPKIERDTLTKEISPGGTATLTGQLTEPNDGDVLSLWIEWGDGSPMEMFDPGRDPFAYTHVYANAGTYDVRFTWLDDKGGMNSRIRQVLVATPEVRLITSLYRDLLQREPEAEGLAYWLAWLEYGFSAAEVTQGIRVSLEHRQLQVQGYYRLYLNRDADEQGRTYWVALFQIGASEETVILGFLTSVEYRNLHLAASSAPSDTPSTMEMQGAIELSSLITDLQLPADVDPGAPVTLSGKVSAELARASFQVDWGDGSAPEMFLPGSEPFALSHVYEKEGMYVVRLTPIGEEESLMPLMRLVRVRTSEVRTVEGLYQNLLQRSADAEGLAYWVAILKSGATPDEVAQGILLSPERFGRVVDQSYVRFLGRAAEVEERNYWIDRLFSGDTGDDLIQGFLESAEYRRAHGVEPAEMA